MSDTDADEIEVLASNIETINAIYSPVPSANNSAFLDRLKKERERKFVSRAVMVVSGLLFVLSIILVGVSLMMSKSIDDLVRNSNEMLRKQTVGPPKPVDIPYSQAMNVTTTPP